MSETRTILVIEDSEALLNDIVEMLSLEGFATVRAQNGQMGLDLVAEHQPDLIVCDVRMPIMDGYGVLDRLRADAATSNIPFIFLTARTARSDIREGMELGAADYLTKPFTAEELISAVHTQLDKRDGVKAEMKDKLDELRRNIVLALPHELRTPLNTILGFSEIMMTDTRNMEQEQVVDMASHINQAALRLYRLVENYVIYTNLETAYAEQEDQDGYVLGRTRYPYVVVAQQAEEKSRQYKREDDLKLNVVPVDRSLAIEPENIARILQEVIDNAFKFSKKGNLVEVSVEEDDNMLKMSVYDEGSGMSDEEVASIGVFMQFRRNLHEQQGVGFGLAIAKRITELHNGQFTIQSESDSWTRVNILLPLIED